MISFALTAALPASGANPSAPISAAYGYALGRQLRAQNISLLSPPTVFFGPCEIGYELAGELLRAQQWLAVLADHLNVSAQQES